MKKNSIKIIISSFIVGIIILSVAFFADQSSDIALNNNQVANTLSILPQAQIGDLASETEEESTGYTPISGIDFQSAKDAAGQGGESNFLALLRTIFNWGIAIAIILATLAVVIGAIQYMTTDAIYDKKEGRERITSAIGGLILALISWLILFTINENILSSNFLVRLQELRDNSSQQSQRGGVTTGGGNSSNLTQSQIEQAKAQALSFEQQAIAAKKSAEDWKKRREECFDENDNFIDPPIDPNLCNTFVRLAGVDGINKSVVDAYNKSIELNKKASEIYDILTADQNSKNADELDKLNKENAEVAKRMKEFFEKHNTSQTTNNTPTVTTKLSIQDLIDLNDSDNDRDRYNGRDRQPQLSQDDLNILAFQDKAFENIFVKEQASDITNMSQELESMVLILRDECCGEKTTINGIETYKSSLNISNINTNDNSVFIEQSITDGFGANSWTKLNNLISNNTFPDQNLLDITEYIECRENRSRWRSWTCRKPDNYRLIDDRYYNLENKGVLTSDLIESKTYSGEIKGIKVEIIYQNKSWKIKII